MRYYEIINTQIIVVRKYGKKTLVPDATSNVKLGVLSEFKYL